MKSMINGVRLFSSGPSGAFRRSRFHLRWSLTVLLWSTAEVRGAPAPAASEVEALRTELASARLERMHWERLIATQADLAQHPEKLSGSVQAASEELRSAGRAMTVEGFTLGFSGLLQWEAAALDKRKWQAAAQLKMAAAAIETSHKVFVEDLVRGKNEPAKADAEFAKAVAGLKLAAHNAPTKAEREELEALISFGAPAIQLLGKLMRGDKITWKEDQNLMKDMMEGSRALMMSLITHRKPDEWAGVGRAMARAFPKIGQFAGLAAQRGLLAANLLISGGNICVGSLAWYEGVGLEMLADDLFDQQQHAAEMLRVLVPHARQARASALRREARLERLIRTLEKRPGPPAPKLVPPPRRVLDDGLGVPPSVYSGLQSTVATLQSSPPMAFRLTKNEVRRREEIARAEREAERERQRAEQRAQARREREQRAAERAAQPDYTRGDDPARSPTNYHDASDAIQKVANNVLPNW